MVDIMDKLQQLSELGLSGKEKQGLINVSEAFYAWDIMVTKFDIIETIHIVENFIDDIDLKIIAKRIIDSLQLGIADMEKIMSNYGVPFPTRPPAGKITTKCLEYYTDRYIYHNLNDSIQSFFPVLAHGYMQSTAPYAKKQFKSHLLTTMELHEEIIEYGKLKGFLAEPPLYNA